LAIAQATRRSAPKTNEANVASAAHLAKKNEKQKTDADAPDPNENDNAAKNVPVDVPPDPPGAM
jgi:hypothetical protein